MKDPIRYEIRSELIIHPQGGWVSYEEYIKVKARLDYILTLLPSNPRPGEKFYRIEETLEIARKLIDEKNAAQKKDSASEDKQKA